MIKKIIFLFLGILSLMIGIVGVLVPILPTTPFLVFASFCFVTGSDRMKKWFETTALYKKHLITLKEKKGLTLKTKLRILIPFYCILSYLIIANDVFIMRVVIGSLLIIKTIVFVKIKTIPELAPE